MTECEHSFILYFKHPVAGTAYKNESDHALSTWSVNKYKQRKLSAVNLLKHVMYLSWKRFSFIFNRSLLRMMLVYILSQNVKTNIRNFFLDFFRINRINSLTYLFSTWKNVSIVKFIRQWHFVVKTSIHFNIYLRSDKYPFSQVILRFLRKKIENK